ncbi:MAG: hypothetical protein EBY29_11435 [Planctomycetes bacterium]|nr:hypothetical protein [Planctomycetota bacterium]
MPRYARMVYNGYWFSPERLLLQSLIDQSQVETPLLLLQASDVDHVHHLPIAGQAETLQELQFSEWFAQRSMRNRVVAQCGPSMHLLVARFLPLALQRLLQRRRRFQESQEQIHLPLHQ